MLMVIFCTFLSAFSVTFLWYAGKIVYFLDDIVIYDYYFVMFFLWVFLGLKYI